MSGSHVHDQPEAVEAAGLVAPSAPVGAPGPSPAFGLLGSTDEGTRVRALLRAQRGQGKRRRLTRGARAHAREVPQAGRAPRRCTPTSRSRWTSSGRRRALKAKYTAAAKEDFAKAKEHFSAESLEDGVEVPAEMTELTAEQVARALGYAWQKVFDKPIPPGALAILIGKWKTEGARRASPTTTSATSSTRARRAPPAHAPTDYSWRVPEEVEKGTGQRKKKGAWHASFKSVEEGALGLLRWYAGNDARAGVLGALLHGNNPRDYAYAAFGAGFFTAAPEKIVWPATGDILEPGYMNTIAATMPKNDDLAVLLQEAGAGESQAWGEDVAKQQSDAPADAPAEQAVPIGPPAPPADEETVPPSSAGASSGAGGWSPGQGGASAVLARGGAVDDEHGGGHQGPHARQPRPRAGAATRHRGSGSPPTCARRLHRVDGLLHLRAVVAPGGGVEHEDLAVGDQSGSAGTVPLTISSTLSVTFSSSSRNRVTICLSLDVVAALVYEASRPSSRASAGTFSATSLSPAACSMLALADAALGAPARGVLGQPQPVKATTVMTASVTGMLRMVLSFR